MKIKLMATIIIGLLTAEFQQKEMITIQKGKVGIIGYGSLMSKKQTENVIKRKYVDSIYKVHLVGYQRKWNNSHVFPPKSRQEYEGFYVYEGDTIQINRTLSVNINEYNTKEINCVLYLMNESDLPLLDKYESNNERVDVTQNIKEYAFTGGHVYAYKGYPQNVLKTSPNPTDNVMIPKFSYDLVIRACDSIGPDFRKEFESSTQLDLRLVNRTIWKLKK